MKKFLQVTGWILVVFACFYLFGLGERTPRRDLEERMESIEETLDRAEEKNWEAITERYDELKEELAGISGELEELKSMIESETEERKWEAEGAWERIQELEGRLEECEGIIDNEHPGERGTDVTSEMTEEEKKAFWDKILDSDW